MVTRIGYFSLALIAIAAGLAPADARSGRSCSGRHAHAGKTEAGNGAGGSVAHLLRTYYAYQDSGYKTYDPTKVMAHTTSNYTYVAIDGKRYSRDQTIRALTQLLTMGAEKGLTISFKTKVVQVKLDGDTATVDTIVSDHVRGNVPTDDDSAATAIFADGSGFRHNDTWVQIGGVWYLESTVYTANESTVISGTN